MTDNATPGLLLLKKLQNPELYQHPVGDFEILETHISWVLLTGAYAYKIKKPVDLGFVDFSSLDKRRHYCYEELRLNRRLAPELYRDVVSITGSIDHPVINGPGEALEYAVRMQQFAQQDLLDQLAARAELSTRHIDDLADIIAEFHRHTETTAPAAPLGAPDRVRYWAEQNFQQIIPLLQNQRHLDQLEALRSWTEAAYERLSDQFLLRKTQGYIRECHGDLHLGNMALVDGKVVIFDCIEFNQELRWIDLISEVAFLVMDLYDRQYPHLAHRFLDRYLMHTGDYAGLQVLAYYLVYRALVRAKIDLLRLSQGTLKKQQTRTMLREYQSYIDLALKFSQQPKPTLFITHGLAGSGKSTLAGRMVETLGAVRIRSDVERKRLFKLPAAAASNSTLLTGIYTPDATRHTYRQMLDLAEQTIKAGYSVIADATFLKFWQRELFQTLAKQLQVSFVILATQAPAKALCERIERRGQTRQDPSEADLAVLELQRQTQQALTADEKTHTVIIDTTRTGFDDAINAIRQAS